MINNFKKLKKNLIKLKSANNKLSQSAQPIFFNKINFRTNVSNINELIKFVDTHKKTNFSNKKIYTNQDTLIMNKIFKITEKLTYKMFKKKITPLFTSYSDLNNFKSISKFLKIHENKKNINILEIGPGPGYLGLMLSENKKINYTSIENSEGFYIFQNFLYNSYTKKFDEVLNTKSRNIFEKKFKIKHIHTLDLIKKKNILNTNEILDIVTINHCIGEIHPNIRDFYLKLIKRMMLNSLIKYQIQPFLILNSIGGQEYLNLKSFFQMMHKFSFRRIFIPKIGCYVFTIDKYNKSRYKYVNYTNSQKLNKIYELYYYLNNFTEFNKIKKKIELNDHKQLSFRDIINEKKLFLHKRTSLANFYKI